MAERGYALDLTDLLAQWEYKDQLNEDVLAPFVRDGRVYALPSNGYIMGLFYNKKLFKEAGLVDSQGEGIVPANWDEFVETAQKLNNKQKGIAGFGIMGNGAEAGWGFLNWVWQAGGDFQREIDGTWQAVFAEPEAVKALEFERSALKYDVLVNALATPGFDGQVRKRPIAMMFAAQIESRPL